MPIDEEFMKKLQAKYEVSRKGKEDWQRESEKISTILKAIEKDLSVRYKFDSPINIGGTAVVINVTDTNLGIPQALKCPRPVQGKELLIGKIIASEISRLIESAHQNIVAISYKGEISIDQVNSPFYVMEYLEGAVDAWDYIQKHKPGHAQLLNMFIQIAKGLAALHSRNIIHGDCKLENVLVAPDGRIKISDLGSARLLHPGDDSKTVFAVTREFAHPDLRKLIAEDYISDSNRASVETERSKLRKAFDLYALGKNIFRVLKLYDKAEYDLLPPYERNYFSLMAARMLDGDNTYQELPMGLPKSVFTEIKYSSDSPIDAVLIDLQKLNGEYSIHKAIPELDHHNPSTIQISSPVSTTFTDRVATLLSLPIFRKLTTVTQLGFISQIYPTATHSRLEHVLGTFSNVVRYCDALWHDHINPLFKQIFTEHDINLLFLSALCHDIGQYPLAHDLEEAEPQLFSHTKIAQKILNELAEITGLKKLMVEEWHIEPAEVATLLATNPTDLKQPLRLRLLHTLIDGPIDADKVDYLIRDSINLNVQYGTSIDFERLLKCLTVVYKQEGSNTFISLGIHEKGKISAEAIAFARYAMFGTVYWHHASRSIKSMLHRAIWEMLSGVEDRRSKTYAEIRDDLYEVVLGLSRNVNQEILFKEIQVKHVQTAPRLSASDYNMISWVHHKTTEKGKKLLDMICERRLFKRIMVISGRKNPPLWEKLVKLRSEAKWQDMITFQKEVQKNLADIIARLDDQNRTTSILEHTVTDQIVVRAKSDNEVLFLLDIATERKGADIDLYFLSESRIHGPLKSEEESVQTEDSVLWTNLSRNFLMSVGKVRLFCHPDIVEVCTACLTRGDVESAVLGAARIIGM